MFEIWHGHVNDMVQPPRGIQVLDHAIVLFTKRLVDP